ncbi:MAG: hydrogenase accessory protein HypB [Thermodesulfobacterium geofontis]|uniref:Hydrogenase accessory protein HypB n=1 Tax=Thermodesulfobacterium geofontis TaxID=1295609 RepID=A0A2N7QFE6_9BACT|nr:MAG: hydrogenase accessory protein HypB [Thermodesulfobacterium geofontis]PMP97581.1 MAG: hydrogenase accessory protein HypB [Thermodesulfobacterium geofontis]
MCKECGCGVTNDSDKKALEVFEDILKYNKFQARHNREHFEEYKVYAINLMSAPGSGKTTLLEKTLDFLKDKYRIGVIEGDLETEKDAERIRQKGIPVYQITTGSACHLDASLIHKAMHHLPLDKIDFLFVENIGNLVCPANYELGTHLNVTLLSVPEGEDKPEKYPLIFKVSDVVIINKIDLLPYFDFNLDKVKEDIKKIRPDAYIIALSAKTGEGLDNWISFIENKFNEYRKKLA